MTEPVKPVTKTYLELLRYSVFKNTSSIQEVPNRDKPSELPEDVFAFRFFDYETEGINGKQFDGNRLNVSGLTYVDGTVLSLDRVKKTIPYSRTLITNMEKNGWDYVVRTRHKEFFPLLKGDRVTNDGKTIYPDPQAFPPVQKQR